MPAEYELVELSVMSLGADGNDIVRENFLVEESAGKRVVENGMARYVLFQVTDYAQAHTPRTAITLLSEVQHRDACDDNFTPEIPPITTALDLPDQANWVHRGEIMSLEHKESTMRAIATAAFMLSTN